MGTRIYIYIYVDVSIWWIGLSLAAFVNSTAYTSRAFFDFFENFSGYTHTHIYIYVRACAHTMNAIIARFCRLTLFYFYPVQKEGYTRTRTSCVYVCVCNYCNTRFYVRVCAYKILFVFSPADAPATPASYGRSVKFARYIRSCIRFAHALHPSFTPASASTYDDIRRTYIHVDNTRVYATTGNYMSVRAYVFVNVFSLFFVRRIL